MGRHSARRSGWVGWVAVVGVSLLVAVLVRSFVMQSFWIPSGSMEPTLHGCPTCQEDRVLVAKLAYRLHAPRRGDVVVFDRPPGVPDPDPYLIKRVIGLPGDTVSAHGGWVFIGTRPLAESYVASACAGTADFAARTVPTGQVFVLGDNRCDSFDSRFFGAVPESTLVGRAFVIVWPLARRHWL